MNKAAPDAAKTTIICADVPVELLLKKPAVEYFSTFGRLSKITLRPKSQACVVQYEHAEEAAALIESGGDYEGQQFTVEYHVPRKKKERPPKKDPDPDWALDPEVRAELAAMGDLDGRRTYDIRPEKMAVDEEVVKREVKRERRGRSVPATKSRSTKTDLQYSKEQKEFMKIMTQPAYNVEDKLKVLEARDKFIRLNNKKRFHLRSTATVGTCPDMCPEKERYMREVQHQVALYEQVADSRALNPRVAVKQYSRSSADQEAALAHDLRPASTLQLTMGYLLHRIIPLCDGLETNLGDWYHFLWDRTRAIRKDITQQELCCSSAVELVEQCARFHVHCSARLVAEDPSVFDQKINTENLTKCLQTLKYMYHDLRVRRGGGGGEGEGCGSEGEFRAYVILLNLNDGNFMWEVQQLSSEIQKSREVQFALQIHSAIDKNNYIKFFKLVHSTTYLNACILLRYFNQVRIRALRAILKCYSPRAPHSYYPIAELQRILAFEGIASTRDFLEYHSLLLSEDRDFVLLDRRMFQMPDVTYALDRATNVIESKRGPCLGTVICGKGLPEPEFERHEPRSSFKGDYLDLSEFKDYIDKDYDETDDVAVKETKIPASLSGFLKMDSRSNSPTPNKFQPEVITTSNPSSIFGGASQFSSSIFAVNQARILEEQQIKIQQAKELLLQQQRQKEEELRIKQEKYWKEVELDLEMERQKALQLQLKVEEDRIETERLEELRLLEAERERVLELLRIEQEKERVETRRLKELELSKREEKLQEQKRILQQNQIQEQLRVKLIAQQEQRRIKTLEIQQSVELLMQDLLDQVEEESTAEKLLEIATRLGDYKMRLFIKKWRLKTLRNKRKRKSMDLQPQYVQHRSMEDEAKELHTSSQDLTLSLIKRYKYGHALNLTIDNEDELRYLDLPKLVGDILVNKQCNTFMERQIFWKVAISMPDKNELPLGLDRICNTLRNLFDFDQNNKSVKSTSYKGVPLTYCVEYSPRTNISDNNGLIFIGDIVGEILYNRVLEKIKDLRVKSNISVVIILQKESKSDEQLKNLLGKSCVLEYKFIYCHFTRSNIVDSIQKALVFLAGNLQRTPPIEIDSLSNFILQNLVNDFWKRVTNFTVWNNDYKEVLTKPNVAIKLHNEAVNKLKQIIFTVPCSSYRDFPEEFRETLDIDETPCDYKYIPQCWRNEKYRKLVVEALENFILPEFNLNWPPTDEIDLEKVVNKYLCIVFNFAQTEKTFLKVMAVILQYVGDTFEDVKAVSWTAVIQAIVLEKIAFTDFSYKADLNFEQYFVVYNIDDLKNFRRDSWFYLGNDIVKSELGKISRSIMNDSTSAEDFDEEPPEEDLDETLQVLTAKLRKYDEKLFEHNKASIDKLQALMRDLEDSMKIQRKISCITGNNLKNALD